MPEALYAITVWIGGAVCHQQPERSLWVNGTPLPFCARCTGIYVSALAVFTLYFLSIIVSAWKNAGYTGEIRLFPVKAGFFAVLCLLPMEIDGIANLLGIWGSDSFIRLFTGSMFGYGMPVFFILARGYDIKTGSFKQPCCGRFIWMWMFFASCLCAAAAYVGMGGMLTGLVAAAGLIMTLTAFSYVLFTKIERNGVKYFAASFALAWCLVGLLNGVKRLVW